MPAGLRKTARKRVETLYKAEAGQLSRDCGVPLFSDGKQNISAWEEPTSRLAHRQIKPTLLKGPRRKIACLQ